jgi:glycosyltransferase involved in cell wall biosynthesis
MKTPLRILILTPAALPSVTGNAMTAERWRKALSRMGYSVMTLASQGADAHELSKEIGRFRPDIIHTHHVLKAGSLLMEKPLSHVVKGIPFVVSPAGTDISHDHTWGKISPQFIRICSESKMLIIQSPWLLQLLKQILPDMKNRMAYVPKAFLWQGNEMFNFKRMYEWKPENIVFFLPGGIRPVKRNLECLGWLHKVFRTRPSMRAVFAGPALDADYATRFGNEINGSSSFARWIPLIPPGAMRSAYQSADVVLNASISEGLSNTLLEAIAAGRPILASDIPGNRWVVAGNNKSEACGYLFNCTETSDFIEKAMELIDDGGLRNTLSNRCRVRSSLLPCMEDEAGSLAQIYEDVFRRHGGGSPTFPPSPA